MISLESFHDMPKALPVESVENVVYTLRGLRVMLDSDLAAFYGVETKALNQAVRRNIHRFPKDFAFQLQAEDVAALRSQIVTSNPTSSSRGGARYRPWAFTEHGAVMLAGILNSAVAIAASVEIVRAFVKMRDAIKLSGGDLIAKLATIDVRLDGHDTTLEQIIAALNSLLNPPTTPKKEMGFHTLREDEGTTNGSNGTKHKSRPVRYSPKRRPRTGKRKDFNS